MRVGDGQRWQPEQQQLPPHIQHTVAAINVMRLPLTNARCLQPGKTVLYMPQGLRAVYGEARAWAFGGGFVG